MGSSPRELEAAACVLMVETKDGLANVDEIASVPGVDAIYIGPGDLALGLGMGWDTASRSASENEAHASAVEHIRQACERHGVTPGIHVGDAELSFQYAEQGFRLITVASDIGLIFGGSAATLSRMRGARIPKRAATSRGSSGAGRRSSAAPSASSARSVPAPSAKSAPKKGAKPAKSGKAGKAGSTPI
jgi:4-hydroxy-2-oxoheptanedioate aldolase